MTYWNTLIMLDLSVRVGFLSICFDAIYKLYAIDILLSRNGIPVRLRSTMTSYLEQQLSHGDDNEMENLLASLPSSLSTRIKCLQFSKALLSMPIFDSLDNSFLVDKLATSMVLEHINKKVELFVEGDVVREMYVLLEGQVLIIDKTKKDINHGFSQNDTAQGSEMLNLNETSISEAEVAVIDAPSIIGLSSFLSSWRSSVSTVTSTQCIIGSIKREDFDQILNEDPSRAVILFNNIITHYYERYLRFADAPLMDEKQDQAIDRSLKYSMFSEFEIDVVKKLRDQMKSTACRNLLLECARDDTTRFREYAVAGLMNEVYIDNICCDPGVSPLLVASRYGRINVVRSLLSHGANHTPNPLHRIDNLGLMPLYVAIVNRHEEIIDELLLAGATLFLPVHPSDDDVNRRVNECSESFNHHLSSHQSLSNQLLHVLMKAIYDEDHFIVENMLKCGIDPNGVIEANYDVLNSYESRIGDVPPLHFACYIGRSDSVQLLLRYGASGNRRIKFHNEKFGRKHFTMTAMDIARHFDHVECLEILNMYEKR